MWVHRSNRIEVLARALAEGVKAGGGAPLEPEVIVVQSRGMERWLSLTLAAELGVWFGARFPFPRAFIDDVMTRVLGEPGEPVFSRENLTWCVAAELASAGERPGLHAIARSLRDDPTGRSLIALSVRVADLFDQYAVYRPDLVLAWEQGEGDDWQAELFRAVTARLRTWPGVAPDAALHVAGRRRRFEERLRALEVLPAGVPRRVSLFGIATLPPIYLEILAQLGERLEVSLFLLSPSREHVAELRSSREILRELGRRPALDADALHLAEGNPLLATLGHLGRDLARVLEATTEYEELPRELYADPGTATLLHAVQHDLLHLVHRRPPPRGTADAVAPGRPGAAAPLPILDTDRSLEIHACHGPLREVEVLHELLRAAFEADPTLGPHEVIVMAPSIEAYAPLLDAVFGADEDGGARIPYRVADRSPGDASPVVRAVLAVLDVVGGRFTLGEVAELLEAGPVQEKFGIEPSEVPELVELLQQAGVRWGVDGADRAAVGAAELDENSFRFGLRRLLLGHAMGDEPEPFGGVLPLDAGADAAPRVGALAELVAVLATWRTRWRSPRSLGEHAALLGALILEVLAVDPVRTAEVQLVRDLGTALGEAAVRAGFTTPVPLAVFRELLAERLPDAGASAGFLAGGVTCSALLPMRSVPFRLVCLLGMNEADFPRPHRRTSFDRMAAEPRPGDRSSRHEDENLFLEVLLSARERLVISYVGRSMHDDTVRAPSVVVSELIDVLDQGFVVAPAAAGEVPGAGGVGSRRVVHHPIQRFSPRAFPAGAATFDAVALAGARAVGRQPKRRARILAAPLAPRELRELSLEALVAGLTSPARALVRDRLGAAFEDRHQPLEEREPIALEGLEQWALGDELLARALEEPAGLAGDWPADGERLWQLERARGRLPHGTVGRLTLDELVPVVAALAGAAARHRSGTRLAACPVAIELGELTVVGALEELWSTAQVSVRFGRLGAVSELDAWVRHLALQVARGTPAGRELPARTVLVARAPGDAAAAVLVFRELVPATARSLLAELAQLVALAWRMPVPFFPRAARAFVHAERRRSAGTPENAAARALAAARSEYRPASASAPRGEAEDPYVARVFGDDDPLAPEYSPWEGGDGALAPPTFAELARRVFVPLVAACDDGRELATEAEDEP